MKKFIIPVLSCFILTAFGSYAAAKSPGTNGLQFLNIGVGARQSALGDTSCVISDVNSVFVNPALVRNIEDACLGVSHNQWIAGITEQAASVILKTKKGNIGLGLLYLHMDEMDGYDVDGSGNPVKIQDFTSHDLAAIVSYGKKVEGLDAGVSVKIFQEKLEEESVTGAAFDIGLHKTIGGISFGLAIQNIGPKVKFISKEDTLPRNMKFGVGYTPGSMPLLLAADVDKPSDNDMEFSLGCEYGLMERIDFRAGYRSSNDNRDGISAGFGFSISNWIVDYSFIPFGDLGSIHRVSLKTSFKK